MITRDNYEEYMMLLADGELSASEREELKAFVKGDPELEQEMAYWMAARIVPDAREVYAGKEQLLKKQGGIIIGLQRNWSYGIAAGILLLIFLGFYNSKFKSQNSKVNSEITNSKFQIPNSKSQIPNVEEMPVVKEENHAAERPAPNGSIKKPAKIKTEPIIEESKTEQYVNKEPVKTDSMPYQKKQEPVKKEIVANPVKEMPEAPVVVIPEDSVSAVVKPRKNFFARLPFVRKQSVGIDMVTDAISDKVNKVNRVKQDIKGTDIKIKIGNKELLAFTL